MSATETRRYDAIVVGVGGMGSAAAYHLADRGKDVLGLERYDVPHTQGSSHGYTRIIRLAYYEHPSYVPLLRSAYDEWAALGDEYGEKLVHETGSVAVGPPDSDIFEGARRSCREHGLDHDVLSGAALNDRFPGYDVPEDFRAVFQPRGGFLVPEECIVAHVEGAQARGAEIRARTQVRDWRALDDGGVEVVAESALPGADGTATYEADSLVFAAGAWTGKLLPELAPVLEPERQVLGWFQPDSPDRFAPEEFPVFSMRCDEGYFYGFPIHGVPGVKVGKYNHRRETVDPDEMNREPTATDEEILREYVEGYFADAAGPTMRLSTCMFTNTPDERFVIDTHPEHPQVAVAAGFSGHGFKFSSVVGSVVADLVDDGHTDHPIEQFGIDRFDEVEFA
ncbi:N-methyl-L-tryptophan oxidase [Halorussus limi]|uniref:N-methyl-L-tryptophan oxidase n=1 Tax=Halorussus limi TaxID=2938695 RepID=A0A8U0HQY9_9EURY|nr:N-methyl-L-tryptophan oxidase [Halorussus limi]UPV73317.1 N-methyl-L-tryptophan oxidase [Halorussus limi]